MGFWHKISPFPIFKALMISVGLLVASLGACLDTPQNKKSFPYTQDMIAKKNYKGVELHILVHEKPVMGSPVETHAQTFERLTGARIHLYFTPFNKLYPRLLWGLRNNQFDIAFYGSLWIADIADQLAPLPKTMLISHNFQQTLPHIQHLGVWNNIVKQVPVDGDRQYFQYRKDLFEDPKTQADYQKAFGKALKLPETYEELKYYCCFFSWQNKPKRPKA